MLAQHGAFAQGLAHRRQNSESSSRSGVPLDRLPSHAISDRDLGDLEDGIADDASGLDGDEGAPEVPPTEPKSPEEDSPPGEPNPPEDRPPDRPPDSPRKKYFNLKRTKPHPKGGYSRGSLNESNFSVDSSSAWHRVELKGAHAGTARADDDSYRFFVPHTFYVLEPRCKAALVYMVFILIVTIYTSVTTPLEIAWYPSEDWAATPFFFISNVFVIVVFSIDIFANFNLAYVDPNDGFLVADRWKIALAYLHFWFWLDFLATFPFDACMKSGNTKVLRLFKLFRLVRIAKVMTSKRVLRLIESEHAVNYDTTSLAAFFLSLLLLMHLMACGLFMVAGLENNDEDGLTRFYHDNGIETYSVFDQWLVGIYWSAMTVSTIGYGDVGLKNNMLRAYAILCMLVGASTYAYMVGALIQVVLNMNKTEQERRNVLSEVNSMVRAVGLPYKYRRRIRMFFSKTDSGENGLHDYLPYCARLSPPLAGLVIRTVMKDFLYDVWWLGGAVQDNNFIMGFAQLLSRQSFGSRETLFHHKDAANALYICTTGAFIVVGRGRIFASGKGVGEEILLPRRQNYGYSVYASTYVDSWRLERESFRNFLRLYPALHPRIRWTILASYIHRQGGVKYLHHTSMMNGRSAYELEVPTASSHKGPTGGRSGSRRGLGLLHRDGSQNNGNGSHWPGGASAQDFAFSAAHAGSTGSFRRPIGDSGDDAQLQDGGGAVGRRLSTIEEKLDMLTTALSSTGALFRQTER